MFFSFLLLGDELLELAFNSLEILTLIGHLLNEQAGSILDA